MRYHKNVYFSSKHQEDIIAFTYALNNKAWRFTSHCLDNAKLRTLNLEQLLYFIKNELQLNSEDVFEIYTDDNDNIVKACYRIIFNHTWDFILVLDKNKIIITIYINSSNDKHDTLRCEQYQRGSNV
jgi:hypothetical protein